MSEQLSYKPIDKNDEISVKLDVYQELLKSQEWQNLRKVIKQNNNFQCIKCETWETINFNSTPFGSLQKMGVYQNGTPFFKLIKASKHITFHIHHTHYVLERLPWQYNHSDLMCLCADCHMAEHKNNRINVYLTENDRMLDICSHLIPCPKCGGDGYLDAYSYHENGKCFGCNGRCFVRIYNKGAYNLIYGDPAKNQFTSSVDKPF